MIIGSNWGLHACRPRTALDDSKGGSYRHFFSFDFRLVQIDVGQETRVACVLTTMVRAKMAWGPVRISIAAKTRPNPVPEAGPGTGSIIA